MDFPRTCLYVIINRDVPNHEHACSKFKVGQPKVHVNNLLKKIIKRTLQGPYTQVSSNFMVV